MPWIIKGTSGNGRTQYVAAKPGWYRLGNGEYEYDGSASCEWDYNIDHAFTFKTHRAAARVASKCVSATVMFVEPHPCVCADEDCPAHKGEDHGCGRTATKLYVRVWPDTEHAWLCDKCAKHARNCGVIKE